MIIWLASYPKSGNTLLRSMLSAYFFSKEGIYDNFKLIKNIRQFPHGGLFQKLGIDINNHEQTIKSYINVQNAINKNDSIQFFKTHSYFFNFNNKYPFSNFKNTLGAIYIVRDPRNVVTSFAKFKSMTIDNSAKFLIEGKGDGFTWTNTWNENFNSWKFLNKYEKYLLIKYEDLITNPELTFLKILKFVFNLKKTKFKIDQMKFKNTIKTTSFDYLKNLEKEKGFIEANKDPNTGKPIPFFNLGPKNDWKKLLNVKIKKKIEMAFEKEMKELNYL